MHHAELEVYRPRGVELEVVWDKPIGYSRS
jgi:hypothetical protein